MRLGKMLAAVSAVVLVSSPVTAQSDLDSARKVYPMMIECGMVAEMSADYGYTARHPMEEWAELIAPTAEMIGANTEDDIAKYVENFIARLERDGPEATQDYVIETAKTCDEVLDSIG